MNSALVFGGAGGIGDAVSRALVADRHTAITYFGRSARAEALASDLTSAGGPTCRAVRCDATSELDVAGAFDVATGLGELDVVVMCAGGWSHVLLPDLTEAPIRFELDLNLLSGLLILAEASRRVAVGGRIVVISSGAAAICPPTMAVYAAAKAGLEAAAKVAAKELAPRGVTVNVVRPGATDTGRLRAMSTEQDLEAMAGANAMRRLGTPEDVAGAVTMLLGSDAAWVTGTLVDATGGLI